MAVNMGLVMWLAYLKIAQGSGATAWDAFFDLMNTILVPEDFMAERPMNTPPQERELFAADE